MKPCAVLFLIAAWAVPSVCPAQLQVLHRSSTSSENLEGRILSTAVVGTNIYGLTDRGNGNSFFSLDTATDTFDLTELPNEPDQRIFPPDKAGPLATVGDRVIGSFSPGNSDVFSVRTDGSDFQVIAHAETVGLQFPNVIAAAGRVYGSTERGVFSVNPDGSDLRLWPGDIESPISAPLAFDGARLYGATWYSFGFSPGEEVTDVGKIFTVNPDGSDFRALRETGAVSISSIAVHDGTIYGLEDTARGTQIGPSGPVPRKLFAMNSDGSDYRVLHEFAGGPTDGQNAIRVVSNGDQLFGVTRTGGRENAGTIFRSDLGGTNYEIIHNFGAGSFNGIFPNSDLVVIGSSLYGSTLEGGAVDQSQPLGGGGIVYSIPVDANAVPEPTTLFVWLLLSVCALGTRYRLLDPVTRESLENQMGH